MTTPALPDAAYVISRYGATGQIATNLTATYTLIAPVAYGVLMAATELLIPAADVTAERMDLSGKVDFLFPAKWPVTAITKAYFASSVSPPSRPLRIAGSSGLTQADLFSGKADVAIGEDGEVISLAPWLASAACQGVPVFVDYHAGLDTFPDDLKEVFCQLCWLIAKEKDRIGTTIEKMDVAQTTYTRKLPDWARLALDGYKRVQVFV